MTFKATRLGYFLKMIILCSSMQGQDTFLSVLMASAMCLQYIIQEEDILEHV